MNKLNAIIIEDEVPAARLLHSMIYPSAPAMDTDHYTGQCGRSCGLVLKIIHNPT